MAVNNDNMSTISSLSLYV